MKTIPESAFSVRDAEVIIGLAYNSGYRLVREGKLEATTSPSGQKRIARDELIRYLKKQERINKAVNS